MKVKNMYQVVAACVVGGVALFSSATMAGNVDLSSWDDEGDGTWVLQSGDNAVEQTENGEPTVFFNKKNSQGTSLSGEITVQTSSDNDFIGFVLGYNAGDLTNSAANYILIDWKQGDQNAYSADGYDGLAISRVTGALGSTDAWGHTGNVEELARATTFGSTGWADNALYTFDLIFTSSLIEVKVNGVTELSITDTFAGTFNDGSFGFYNFSQDNVLYAGVDQQVVPQVPLPAAVFMFLPALLGFMGLRRKAKRTLA